MLQCARRVQSCDTVRLASAVLHYRMRGECYVPLCLAGVVLRYVVLGEGCLALRHACRVQYCVTVCLASAALRYGMFSE